LPLQYHPHSQIPRTHFLCSQTLSMHLSTPTNHHSSIPQTPIQPSPMAPNNRHSTTNQHKHPSNLHKPKSICMTTKTHRLPKDPNEHQLSAFTINDATSKPFQTHTHTHRLIVKRIKWYKQRLGCKKPPTPTL
jgi:hypothetical protein